MHQADNNIYWGGVGQSYAAYGPPLIPSAADLAYMQSTAAAWATHHGREPRALLLGVTPSIAQMSWPAGTNLFAADHTYPMIRAIWPGNVLASSTQHPAPSTRQVTCANWSALPLPSASRDIAIGDGSFACVRHPAPVRAAAAEVRRVLRDDGILILRCYIQTTRERKEDVVADLQRGNVPSFHWFKFRLLMAMQECTAGGTPIADVHRYWTSLNIDEEALAARTGWDLPGIQLIHLYRDAPAVHTFATLGEMRALLLEFFEDVVVSTTSGYMGDRCPVLAAGPRATLRACLASGVAECLA